jgi:hypothetical protein
MSLHLLPTPMLNLLDNSTESSLIIGGLALLAVAIVVIVLFWRMSQQARHKTLAPPAPSPSPVEPAAAITPPPPVPAEITLEFPSDTGHPVVFTLDKPALTVGRDPDNDICIPASVPNADTVSKHHARLRRDQDDYIVHDLSSTNGLAVNDRQTLENLLQDGDRLRFGAAEAIFHRPLAGGSPAYHGKPGGAA